MEPMKVSGGVERSREEAYQDRFGRPLLNSAWEPLRGPQVEFEYATPTVRIEQNVPLLQLPLCNSMVNTVNSVPMWGMPRRTIRLADFSWERRFYGPGLIYYTRVFDFAADWRTFDRVIQDEGTRVLSGRWHPTTGEWEDENIAGSPPDPKNPAHFIQAKDRENNPMRVVLDGKGRPWNPPSSAARPDAYGWTWPDAVTGDCTSAPDLAEGILYGPNTIGSNNSRLFLSSVVDEHWWRIPGTGVRAVNVMVDETTSMFRSDPKTLTVNLWKGVCGGLSSAGTAMTFTDNDADCSACSADAGDFYVQVTFPNWPGVSARYFLYWLSGSCPGTQVTKPGAIHVQKYNESNFFLLGVPLVL